MTFDFNALGGMDPEEMKRHLETMRVQAEQRLTEFEAARERIAAISVTVTDPDGQVTVTIGSDANISELAIAPEVPSRRYPALGAVIIATLEEARAQLQERLEEASPR